MLTKQERAAIAERLRNTEEATNGAVIGALLGTEPQNDLSSVISTTIIACVILDLCDTSNMVELPLDKDGEVIRVGDEVCNELGDAGYVISIKYLEDEYIFVRVLDDIAGIVVAYSPNSLTHRHSTKAEQLAESITSAIEVFEYKLRELLAYVESLGDSDD